MKKRSTGGRRMNDLIFTNRRKQHGKARTVVILFSKIHY